MVILKKPSNDWSAKGQVKGIAKAVAKDGFEQLKEAGKDIMTGLSSGGEAEKPKSEKDKSWEEEWLKDPSKKDKPPMSEKEGEHSKLDTQKTFGEHDKKSEEQIRSRISSMLNNRFTQASQTSEHGQEKAKEQQDKNKPIYEKLWEEKEQREKQERENAAKQQQNSISSPQGKTGRGSALVGKKKHKPSPMELNRAEFRGAKGK